MLRRTLFQRTIGLFALPLLARKPDPDPDYLLVVYDPAIHNDHSIVHLEQNSHGAFSFKLLEGRRYGIELVGPHGKSVTMLDSVGGEVRVRAVPGSRCMSVCQLWRAKA